MTDSTKAVVAFSGGQDSTTCLLWALDRWGEGNVHAVSFDYGQRHRVELEVAKRICEKLGVPQIVLSLPAFRELGAAALTTPAIDVRAAEDVQGSGNAHAERVGLPSTFVPGRNLVFLSLVSAYAVQHNIRNVVTGICEADDAGYPDCRASFKVALEEAICEGMGTNVGLWAPLLALDKAQTFALAAKLNGLELVLDESHTCYEGDHDTRHEWGFGCGSCPACVERAKGWDGYLRQYAGNAGALA